MIRSALMAKEIQIIQLSISAYMVFGIAGAVCVDAGNVSARFVLHCALSISFYWCCECAFQRIVIDELAGLVAKFFQVHNFLV